MLTVPRALCCASKHTAQTSGDLSATEPPVPIPNTPVKRCSADDSMTKGHAKVGHRQYPFPLNKENSKARRAICGLFCIHEPSSDGLHHIPPARQLQPCRDHTSLCSRPRSSSSRRSHRKPAARSIPSGAVNLLAGSPVTPLKNRYITARTTSLRTRQNPPPATLKSPTNHVARGLAAPAIRGIRTRN